jgi:hypothetical protein
VNTRLVGGGYSIFNVKSMVIMKNKLIATILVAATIVTVMGVVTPVNAQQQVYLVLFSLLYTFFSLVFLVIIDIAYPKVDIHRRRFSAIVLGFSPTLLLAFASLSSVTFIDFILATGIPAAIVWYGIRGGTIK